MDSQDAVELQQTRKALREIAEVITMIPAHQIMATEQKIKNILYGVGALTVDGKRICAKYLGS